MDIKVVNFSGIRTAANITPAVIDQLHEAFTMIGFVIITNHGVEEKAKSAFRICREFFDQLVEEKFKLKITKETNTSGYSCVYKVIIPDDGSQYKAILLFVQPDVDTMVERLDGSNKYPAGQAPKCNR